MRCLIACCTRSGTSGEDAGAEAAGMRAAATNPLAKSLRMRDVRILGRTSKGGVKSSRPDADPGLTIRAARSLRSLLIAVAVVVASSAACSSGSSSPREVARDYVTAINEHDGDRICDLFVDRLRRKYRYRGHSCGRLVGGLIGYGEESDTPTFVRGRLTFVGKPSERRNYGRSYTGVPMRLSFVFDDPTSTTGELERHRFRDVLWLERSHGSWRIAKESLALYSAWAAYQVPRDALQPPDPLAAKHAAEAAAREHERERTEYRRSFVTPEHRPIVCNRTAAPFDDPPADILTPGSTARKAPNQSSYRDLDVRRVVVDATSKRVCATFRFTGRLKPPFRLTLSLGSTASLFKCCAVFEVLWPGRGQVRFGSPAGGYAFDRRVGRLIPIEGGRVFLGDRVLTLLAPAAPGRGGLPFPAASMGWFAFAGRTGTPGSGDSVPGIRGPYKLLVRLRDGRVMLPTP